MFVFLPPKAFQAICSAIGALVVHWSFIDNAATICVNAAFEGGEGWRSDRNEIPIEWRRKTSFIRECLNGCGKLSHLKSNGLHLIDKASTLANKRHFIIHGTITDFIEQDDPILVFTKLDRSSDKTSHDESTFRISAITLAKLANKCCDVGSDFLKLADGFQKSFVR